MSIITMNMSSYVVEETSPADVRHEIERANWVHQTELALGQQVVEQTGRRGTLPPSLANIDAEMFLQKMSAYQD
jgi:hypothetical protein